MKKHAILAFVLCAAVLAGCGEKEEPEEKILRTVETTTAGEAPISDTLSYSGKAAASREVPVVPTVPGKVTSYQYDVGDRVGQGAVLFTVDSTDLQNNMRSLDASYNAAKLGYDNAKKTYDNNAILFEEEIISEQELDQMKYSYESAQANLDSIQVQKDNLSKNIADCSVTSPLSGVVAVRGIEKGGFATQASPAYVIMDVSVIKIEVGVSEQIVNRISKGDQVDVTMTAVSEEPLKGTVSTISPAAMQTGTYTVKIELNNSDNKIKPGMMADVDFTLASSDDSIILPVNSVLKKNDETYVYVVENGKAKKTLVETGIETGELIEIKSGLTEGSQVVTKGQTYITDGEKVKVQKPDSSKSHDKSELLKSDKKSDNKASKKGE